MSNYQIVKNEFDLADLHAIDDEKSDLVADTIADMIMSKNNLGVKK